MLTSFALFLASLFFAPARGLVAAGWRHLARADGVATDAGRARAARALRDETRWQVARRTPEFELAAARYDGFTRIEDVLTSDQIAEIDTQIGSPKEVTA